MNSFMISLGAMLVLALTTALIGPSFVDWNDYRAVAEAEAAKVFGRPVEITGDLDVAILPAPVVRAGSIRVLADDDGDPLVIADEVKLSIALGSLILGRMEITNLELVRPAFRLDRMLSGGVVVNRIRPARSDAGVLKHIVASDARIVFEDPFDGGRREVAGVDFAVTAGSLSGPFRITGFFSAAGNGDRPAFSASLGSVNPGAPVKLAGRAELSGIGNLAFDGALAGFGSAQRFEGKLRLERALASAGENVAGKLSIETISDIGPGDADFSTIKITATRGAHALSVGGAGRVSWVGKPDFSFDLKARQIDLDGLLASDVGDPAMATDLADLAESVDAFVVDQGASGRIQLALGGAVWRNELARDIEARIEISPDAITIANFSGQFPGETEISLTGRLDIGSEPGFAGDIVADTIGAGRLATWLAPQDAAWVGELLANTRGKLSIRARAEASLSVISLDHIDGFVDNNPFTGGIVLEAIGERRHLRAKLDFDQLDLDRYLPANAGLGDLVDAGTVGSAADSVFPDLSFDFNARRLSFQGRQAEGVQVVVGFVGGALDIDRFEIEQFAGSKISANGRVEPSENGPLGTLELKIATESVPGLLAALHLPMGDFKAASLLKLDFADILMTIASARVDDGHQVSATISGDLERVAADVTLESDTTLARLGEGVIRVNGTVEAEDGRDIFGPQGLMPVFTFGVPGGAASVSLSVEGEPADGLDVAIEIDGHDTHAEAAGRLIVEPFALSGETSFKTADSSSLISALGLGGENYLTDAETSLTSTVATRDGRILFEPITGTLAGGVVSASLGLLPGERPVADLDFQAEFASLPTIAEILFSKPSGSDADRSGIVASSEQAAWPTVLIDVGILNAATLSVKGAISSLTLAGDFDLANASINAQLADRRLSITKLTGTRDGGTVRAAGAVESIDHALVINGTVGLADIPLSSLLADSIGRNLLDGRLSAEAKFEARGRSMLSIVSSLAASGTISIGDGAIPRLDAGVVFDIGEFAEAESIMVATIIGKANDFTDLGDLSGPVEAANGRFKLGPLGVETETISGQVTSFVDVASRHFDQEITLVRPGSPSGIQLALVHAGALGEITRQVEITNLPRLGPTRWTEPDRQRSEPATLPQPIATSTPTASERPGVGASIGSPVDLHAGRSRLKVPRAPIGPPVGLFEQEVIDLPILEPATAGDSDGRAG